MRHTGFPRVRWWRRGYHCKQVEGFLAMVEVSLDGRLPPMAASDIRRAGFELVRHGYSVPEVDEHLDSLEERVLTVQRASSGRRGRTNPLADEQFLRDELDAPYMRRFPRAGMLRRGYHVDDVDEFIDTVTRALAGTVTLTVEQARAVGFRPKYGGYDEDAVDETLDRVVEILLVQRRGAVDTAGTADIAGAADTADAGAATRSDAEPAGPTV